MALKCLILSEKGSAGKNYLVGIEQKNWPHAHELNQSNRYGNQRDEYSEAEHTHEEWYNLLVVFVVKSVYLVTLKQTSVVSEVHEVKNKQKKAKLEESFQLFA